MARLSSIVTSVRAVLGVSGDDRGIRPILTELNLTYPQYLVLLVLWEEDPASQSASFGGRLQLDRHPVALLKRLEANGLVRRERSQADESPVDVTLTDAAVASNVAPNASRSGSSPRPLDRT